MAIRKMFDGKRYKFTKQFDVKREAKEYAETLRVHGYFSRVVKTGKTPRYHVYRRVGGRLRMG